MKDRIVFISGIFLVAIPILGVPNLWKDIMLFTVGGLLIFFSAKEMLKKDK